MLDKHWTGSLAIKDKRGQILVKAQLDSKLGPIIQPYVAIFKFFEIHLLFEVK